MNYYNPYFSMLPYSYTPATTASRGLLGGLLGGGRLSSIINGTQRTLGLVNQAIPLVKQMSPVMKNAKTMFRVMNEFKRVDKPSNSSNKTNISKNNNINYKTNDVKTATEDMSIQPSNSNGPTFFM